MALLSVHRLSTEYAGGRGTVRAVDDVSLEIEAGETVALVGESGCGKSSLGKSLMRLVEPSSGKVTFKGADVTAMSSSQLRGIRRRIQMIFQDPFASLNPRQTVRTILTAPLRCMGSEMASDSARLSRPSSPRLDYHLMPSTVIRMSFPAASASASASRVH